MIYDMKLLRNTKKWTISWNSNNYMHTYIDFTFEEIM
jgi:hypothetical protein